jgi:hypothetical protein
MLSAQVSHARLEELLLNWARWCRGSIVNAPDVVMGLDYEAPGEEAMDARRQPDSVPPRDYDGLLIERMVIKLPERERRVLRVEYVYMPRRKVETIEQLRERRRRRLKMPAWQYEDYLARAKRMVINLMRRHEPRYR